MDWLENKSNRLMISDCKHKLCFWILKLLRNVLLLVRLISKIQHNNYMTISNVCLIIWWVVFFQFILLLRKDNIICYRQVSDCIHTFSLSIVKIWYFISEAYAVHQWMDYPSHKSWPCFRQRSLTGWVTYDKCRSVKMVLLLTSFQ